MATLDFHNELQRLQDGHLPDSQLFRHKLLKSFLLEKGSEFLTVLQNKSVATAFCQNSKNTLKFLEAVFNWESSRLPEALNLVMGIEEEIETTSFQNQLFQWLQSLCERDESEGLILVSWIARNLSQISSVQLGGLLEVLLKVCFFEMKSEVRDKLIQLLGEGLKSDSLERMSRAKELEREFIQGKQRDDFPPGLDEFLPAWVSSERGLMEISQIKYLLHYHDFYSGTARAYNGLKNKYPNLLTLFEDEIRQVEWDKFNWKILNQIPEKADLLTALQAMEDMARKRFVLRFLGALLLTFGFCYFLDPEHTHLWVAACVLLNMLEAYFAFVKPGKLFYLYKYKMGLIKISQGAHPLLFMYFATQGVKIENQYHRRLFELVLQDPWRVYPPLLKSV